MKCDDLKTMTVLNAYQVECDDNDLVYLKSEVDKVLMELDMENYNLKEQLRKYKRIRADWVAIGCYRKFAASSSVKEETFWFKWLDRWINIEDKLKETE